MKVKFISYIASLFLLSGFTACEDYLDTTPTDRISDKIVWASDKHVTSYVTTFYAYLDRYGNFGNAQFNGNMTEGLTETLKYGSYVPGSLAGDANTYVFTPETMSPTSYLLNTWGATYERIRRVNEFLVGLEKNGTFDEATTKKFEAQARFFRAYLYFQLAKRHDGVILYKDLNMDKNTNRSSATETWDFIASDLDFAASALPTDWGKENSGRVTKGAAFAFKSRAMLYAERWEDAKNAADSVFALSKYKLEANYKDSWLGGNSESILEYNYLVTGPNHSFDKGYATYGEIMNQGGSGTPTQEMVEAYEKTDGSKVDWSPWHVDGGTTAIPPYSELEPRFHATVIYPGSTWQGKVMQNSVNGTNGRYMGYREDTYPQGRTTTGYYLRKLRDEKLTDLQTYASSQTWVEIRLAEVYLNRAEANYRLGKATAALSDINKVRERVGLPAKTGISGNDLFNAIRQERKVELSYEGHLYWDMRRWELAHKEYNAYRVHGFKVTEVTPGTYKYQYVDCDLQDRKFLEKYYVFPIPYSELSNNSAIEQYDEWK